MCTITRKTLVEIAFQVLERHKYYDITKTNRNHLLYAACTVDKIALGDWVISPTCGCLVGSVYLNALDSPEDADLHWEPDRDSSHVLTMSDDEAYALEVLGMDFDDLLRAAIGVNAPANGEVQVID